MDRTAASLPGAIFNALAQQVRAACVSGVFLDHAAEDVADTDGAMAERRLLPEVVPILVVVALVERGLSVPPCSNLWNQGFSI